MHLICVLPSWLGVAGGNGRTEKVEFGKKEKTLIFKKSSFFGKLTFDTFRRGVPYGLSKVSFYKFWREEAILLTIKIDIYQDLVLKLTFPHFFRE